MICGNHKMQVIVMWKIKIRSSKELVLVIKIMPTSTSGKRVPLILTILRLNAVLILKRKGPYIKDVQSYTQNHD